MDYGRWATLLSFRRKTPVSLGEVSWTSLHLLIKASESFSLLSFAGSCSVCVLETRSYVAQSELEHVMQPKLSSNS